MSIHLRLIIGSSIFAVLALLFAAFSYHSQSVSLGFAQNFYDGGIDPLGRLQVAKGKTVARSGLTLVDVLRVSPVTKDFQLFGRDMRTFANARLAFTWEPNA